DEAHKSSTAFPRYSSETHMNPVGLTHFLPLCVLRWSAFALDKRVLWSAAALLPLLAMGCAQFFPSWDSSTPAVHVARAAGADGVELSLSRPVVLPADAAGRTTYKSLPINLDTDFRLAE